MRRREFIGALGGATVAWPLAGRAQQPARMRHVGVLMGSTQTEPSLTYIAAFFARLEELGWARGHNMRADVRWWNGGPEQMQPSIADMVASSPEVIMAFTNLALAQVKPMAGNVPVVFVAVGDPIGSGFVASLWRCSKRPHPT
jgi:putative tryptophan/tyrosine transport system substrate-binding protein